MIPLRNTSLLFALIPLLASLVACGGSGHEDPLATPCAFFPQEPSLVISSAQNSLTGATVPVLTLSSITVNGVAFNTQYLSREAFNVRAVASGVLECTAPCGFSTQEGVFSFTVSATSYVDRSLTANGTFSSSSGAGCSTFRSGGTRIVVSLVPQ